MAHAGSCSFQQCQLPFHLQKKQIKILLPASGKVGCLVEAQLWYPSKHFLWSHLQAMPLPMLLSSMHYFSLLRIFSSFPLWLFQAQHGFQRALSFFSFLVMHLHKQKHFVLHTRKPSGIGQASPTCHGYAVFSCLIAFPSSKININYLEERRRFVFKLNQFLQISTICNLPLHQGKGAMLRLSPAGSKRWVGTHPGLTFGSLPIPSSPPALDQAVRPKSCKKTCPELTPSSNTLFIWPNTWPFEAFPKFWSVHNHFGQCKNLILTLIGAQNKNCT